MQSQLISRLTGIFDFLNKYDKSASSPVSVKAEANAGVASTIVKGVATAVENAVATSPVESKKGDKNSVAVAEHLSTSPLVKEIVTAIATTISQASKTSADAQPVITPTGTLLSASKTKEIPPEDKISAQIAPIVAVVTNAVASSPLENETSTVSSHASNPSTKVAPTSLTTNLENKLKNVFTYLEKYRKPSIGAQVVTGLIVAPITTTTLPSSETDSTSAINKESMQTLPSSVTNSTSSTFTPVATASATVQVEPSTSKIITMKTLGSSEEQKPHSTVPLSFTGVTTTLVGEKDNKPTQTINTYDFSKK